MPASTHIELADALTGAVVLPGDPDWDEARSGFNLLGDQHPEAVAFPVDASDVAAAVTYARRAGMRVAPQATGHNQDPLGDLDGTLLLNVSRLREVRVDPGARQVRVGAGVKWDRASRRGSPPTGSPACTAPRPTSGSPATRWAAAWAGSPASTACRRTPSQRSSS